MWEKNEGRTGGTLSFFDFELNLMDDRTFRAPKVKPGEKDELYSHWGLKQEKDLLELLKKNPKKLHFVVNGDQVFGGYSSWAESYEGDHPESFKNTLRALRDAHVPLFLLSGDRHFLELQKIEKDIFGFETYELTSSAIHAIVFPTIWDKNPNPRQIEGYAQTFNYAWVEPKKTKKGWLIQVVGRGPGGKIFFKRTLQVSGPERPSPIRSRPN
jgi:hypothetical protein